MKFEIMGQSAEINESDYIALQKVANSDLVGLIGGDWLKYWRWNNLVKIAEKFRRTCEQKGFEPQAVSPKFLSHFFESSSLEEEEDMQNLWAKLLVSESESRGSVSLRTLQILKFMTAQDAKIFQNLLQYVVRMVDDNAYIYNDTKYHEKFGILYSDLLKMEDLGLIYFKRGLSLTTTVSDKGALIWTSDYCIRMQLDIEDEEKKLNIPAIILTKAGFDIYKLDNYSGNLESLKYIVDSMKDDTPDISISLHKLNYISEDGIINYKSYDLMEKV